MSSSSTGRRGDACRRTIITGIAGDNCVLFTAADAYMRELDVAVPSDCAVSLDAARNRSALEHMK